MFPCCSWNDCAFSEKIPETLYYEFTSVNAQSGQKQLVPWTPQNIYPQFNGWQRTKIKLINYQGLRQVVRERQMSSYYDQEFPHGVSSIGKQLGPHIEWKRVGELVLNPIYISSATMEDWKKFRCSNKSLQSALYLLRKHSPHTFRELMSKQLIKQGIYEFRMMNKGVLTNVIIDDFIPAIDGMPVNAKPYRTTEVFPILIEKALAKAFGSYTNIPDNPLPLVEALAITPVLMWPLNNTVNRDELMSLKSRIDVESSSNCFLPRKGLQKIQHGLLEDQPYMIMAVHEVLYSNRPIVLYEVINLENKGDWNGPFSYFDQNWSKVQPSQAATLKARTESNDSIMIEQSDVLKYFSLMAAIVKAQGCSQEWTSLEMDRHHASYLTITVNSNSQKIYIKSWACEPCRQVMLLAKVLGNNTLEYAGGSMVERSDTNFIRSTVSKGQYVLFLKVEHTSVKSMPVTVNITSKLPVDIAEASKAQHPDFLMRFFYGIIGGSKLKPQIDNPYFSVYTLYRRTGYAFLLFKPSRPANNFAIDEKLLLLNGFKLRKPYSGRSTVQLAAGQSQLMTMKMLSSPNQGQTAAFPEGSIRPVAA